MPPSKHKIKWRTAKRIWDSPNGYEGTLYEERSCSRGGIFIAKLVRTHVTKETHKRTRRPRLQMSGHWVLQRADGSVHSQGTYDDWTGYYRAAPGDDVIEELARGATVG